MNAFGAKERSEIHRYHKLLNVLRLFIVGIALAKCIGHTFSLCLLVQFSFPCLSNVFVLTCVTDDDIYEVKTIACEAILQIKRNLKLFKGLGIIYQEIVAAFTSFITTVKRT